VAKIGSGGVVKLRGSDGAVLGAYRVGKNPISVLFDGTSIWVTTSWNDYLVKLAHAIIDAVGNPDMAAIERDTQRDIPNRHGPLYRPIVSADGGDGIMPSDFLLLCVSNPPRGVRIHQDRSPYYPAKDDRRPIDFPRVSPAASLCYFSFARRKWNQVCRLCGRG
jgi:hypothetical protein